MSMIFSIIILSSKDKFINIIKCNEKIVWELSDNVWIKDLFFEEDKRKGQEDKI